jgi:hypothetical protein
MAIARHFGILLCLASASASGMTIHNTSTPSYITSNGTYSGVASIIGTYIAGGSFGCTGALVSPTVILTAGHCVAPANSWDVTFQTASGFSTVGVAGAEVHPLFANRASNSGIQQYDIAILRLATSAPGDAAVYAIADGSLPLSFSDTTGTVVDMVGYGLGGNPSGALPGGTRRTAQNRLFGILAGEVDNPLLTAHDFSSASEPGNFGIVAAGDSGGPMFLGNTIIGVASASTVPRITSGTYTPGVYYGLHANLYDSLTLNWTNSAIANIPEPGTYLLFASGLAAVALLRRRRA